MNTVELHNYMMSDPYIRPYYGGTLAKDQLPPPPTETPKMYIVNQQNSDQPGNHWIVVWIDAVSEYFDSLGKKPSNHFRNWLSLNERSYAYNTKRLQNANSDVCGQYCLMYSYFRCRGLSLQKFLDMFDKDLHINDVKVKYFYDVTV